MFKSSRVKIILSIMLSLFFLFAATLSVILFASYREVRSSNTEKLSRYVELYYLDHEPEIKSAPGSVFQPDSGHMVEDRPDYQLSTFYSVAFSDDGTVIRIDSGDRNVYEDETLTEIAAEVLGKKSHYGSVGNLFYSVTVRPGYTLVAFLDNTIAKSSLDILLHNVLIAGGSATAILFLISLFVANRIISPLEENDRRQKQFISDASHELKTPISVIGANSEILSSEIGDNIQIRKWI